ncbi:hypothetical protein OESDEN_22054 [Oesophagostomum dentatum]|uniref:Uncharacterized protein n=1 Tax=Oesophagostomum dentatum TaxID=61180 RepID=A0A0B1S358_OESDE|nr:hypothetical protein OESDEN_22054 [Oesophagostomum dentatum]
MDIFLRSMPWMRFSRTCFFSRKRPDDE